MIQIGKKAKVACRIFITEHVVIRTLVDSTDIVHIGEVPDDPGDKLEAGQVLACQRRFMVMQCDVVVWWCRCCM